MVQFKASIVFEQLWQAIVSKKYRVLVLQGGSRSGKTTAIIQVLILLAYQKRRRITIWRLKRSWIKPSVYADLVTYLQQVGLYSRPDHGQSEMTYALSDSIIEFGGLDDAQRLHGLTQDIAWLNEAIEVDKNSFDQLEMRTRDLIILDYNPSEEDNWVYDLAKRSDVCMIHSTQKNNPFLPAPIRRKIMSYEPTPHNIRLGTADEYKWKVYGLGLPAQREGLIFPTYELIPNFPEEARSLGYGLDFGFYPDPAAFAHVGIFNGRLIVDELFCETDLNNIRIAERPELPSIQHRLEEYGISRRDGIVADSAAKAAISELRGVGYNIQPVAKYPGSVADGLELMQQYAPFYATERSLNFIRELKNYSRRKDYVTGRFLKEPIDAHNHTVDLVRYVV